MKLYKLIPSPIRNFFKAIGYAKNTGFYITRTNEIIIGTLNKRQVYYARIRNKKVSWRTDTIFASRFSYKAAVEQLSIFNKAEQTKKNKQYEYHARPAILEPLSKHVKK